MNVHQHGSAGIGYICQMFASINTACQVLEIDRSRQLYNKQCLQVHRQQEMAVCRYKTFKQACQLMSQSISTILTQSSQESTVPNKHLSSSMACFTLGQLSRSQRSLTALKYVETGRPQYGYKEARKSHKGLSWLSPRTVPCVKRYRVNQQLLPTIIYVLLWYQSAKYLASYKANTTGRWKLKLKMARLRIH